MYNLICDLIQRYGIYQISICNSQGSHLLGPTGSDLKCHGKKGTVFAGYHYDISFLTIHGRSRFPGLSIWLRNGQKVEVKVPLGCLLIQTGKEVYMPTMELIN